MLNDYLIPKLYPKANPEQVVLLDEARITVLTPELIRVEVADSRIFTDDASQIVWYRDLGECKFTIDFNDKEIVIKTEVALFHFNRKKRKVDFVTLDGTKRKCDNSKNLKGTARTLDRSGGAVRLEKGVVAKNGISVFEDKSLLLKEDGKLYPREGGSDTYIFASLDYRKTLRAYFGITGFPTMVPRYALGNWWSRYHAYTQDEYVNLMDRFKKEKVPFSVATVDMDWHYVKIEKSFGKEYRFVNGWTGYSFNKNLFPDYKKFLSDLHERNLAVSLNLHPAKGIRSYEDVYPAFRAAMGMNEEGKETIEFNLSDDAFNNAYFDTLHRPYEKEGVDVWWIDWQQGKKSKQEGLDPLWALNHYHSLESAAGNRRPLILSRYSGFGSHRYPIGFSGDTMVLWTTLAYQPYFTANAANCGYFTWSHDIGGHMFGMQGSHELYLRWIQYGVFSPIMRLHSTKYARSKEPWNHSPVEELAKESLRLRHRLIPYIYTAYRRAYDEGRPICEPLYYSYPTNKSAYAAKREYYFGTELIVAPIASPTNKIDHTASVRVWLPEGRFTDIFTGRTYQGGRWRMMTRHLDSIPVLAKAGAIIPLANYEDNETGNPTSMDIWVYGGNNSYKLYEDDGISRDYENGTYAETEFSVSSEDGEIKFYIRPASGDISVLPQERDYAVFFKDLLSFESAEISINGEITEAVFEGKSVKLKGFKPTDEAEIILKGIKLI